MNTASIDMQTSSLPNAISAGLSTATKKKTRSSSILLESTQQFCAIKRPTFEDVSNFKAFFYQFIDSLPDTDKRQISAILARNPYTPRPVGLYLAMDRLDVAAPFLLFSPILGETDLKAISRKMGNEYSAVIQRRYGSEKTLGINEENLESSTAVLNGRVSYQDEVIANFTPNVDVKLKPQAPIKISQKVLESSDNRGTSEISEPIVVVPAASLPKETTAPSLTTETKKDGAWLSSDEIVALASVGGKLGQKTISVATAKTEKTVGPSLKKLNITTLISQARAIDHKAFSQTISEHTGLSANRVLSLINQTAGDELVYLIKAMDIPEPRNLQLLLMLAPKHGRSLLRYKQVKKLLTDLNVGVCRMIFNEVGAKFEIPGAPKPVRIEGSRQDADFSHSVKMRRAHISSVSRAELTPAAKATSSFGRKAS